MYALEYHPEVGQLRSETRLAILAIREIAACDKHCYDSTLNTLDTIYAMLDDSPSRELQSQISNYLFDMRAIIDSGARDITLIVQGEYDNG